MGRNLIAKKQVTQANVETIIAGMKRVYPDAMRDPPARLIEAMTNDQGDRHVLATAVHAGSEVIVSRNARHFPPDSLEPYGIEVQSVDEFLLNLLSVSEPTMAKVVQNVLARYKKPPYTVEQLLGIYATEAPGFADAIAQIL